MSIFGMGNPLLDISAVVPASFLEKYDLKPANAVLAEEKHLPMYQEMRDNFEVEYIAGGSTQNSIRVAQWMLEKPQSAAFAGCIGKDHFGEELKKAATSGGVDCHFLEDDKEATGTCAVLVVDHERSLCANIAAANAYNPAHMDGEAFQAALAKADVFYMASFFLTACPEAALKLAKYAHENNKIFAMNLAAPFLIDFFGDRVDAMLPYVDILFANETEAHAFAKKNNWDTTDVKEITKLVGEMPGKLNESRKRTVVFTQGPDPAFVYSAGEVKEYPANPCPEKELVDVNGAGDSFVGGFLAQWVQGKGIDECMRAGHWASSIVIRRAGCTFPEKCDFE